MLQAQTTRLAQRYGALSKARSYCTRAHPKGTVVVVTSGKGGVGKTTTSASFGYGLAKKGFKTCIIDFDIGLRNVDVHFGIERRVIYDFVHVITGEAKLSQALVVDKENPNLQILAASQTKDKTVLDSDKLEGVMEELKSQFDFVICDSPAGIEAGAFHAMYYSDVALICTNPETSSIQDADKMLGFIASKSKRSENGQIVKTHLLVNRYNPARVARKEMISTDDIKTILRIPLLGVVPESTDVLSGTNVGRPVITIEGSEASIAFTDAVDRFLGKDIPMKFLTPKNGFMDFISGFMPSN
mmetsp:Transcript_22920/g.25496  ORF Transcript_22920/g.25496 Transcript_22920/m.25496 type:complete len:300 (+) Transcript_22920:36-935(+)